MKAIDLRRILDVLENPRPAHRIEVPKAVAVRAKAAIEKMFEIADA